MRLYVTRKGQWAGTQADAKRLAKEEGTGWEQVEVPTDKEGLLCFLNCHRVDAMCDSAKAMVPEPVEYEPDADGIQWAEPKPTYQPDPEKVERSERAWTAGDIVDFILERATVAQVENIFSAIGCRFAEARKR